MCLPISTIEGVADDPKSTIKTRLKERKAVLLKLLFLTIHQGRPTKA